MHNSVICTQYRRKTGAIEPQEEGVETVQNEPCCDSQFAVIRVTVQKKLANVRFNACGGIIMANREQ